MRRRDLIRGLAGGAAAVLAGDDPSWAKSGKPLKAPDISGEWVLLHLPQSGEDAPLVPFRNAIK